MPNTPLPARAMLVVAYLLHAGAGVAAVLSPPASIAKTGWSFLWGAFLVIGGLMSAWGAARRRWTGEYIGLPLLIAVWATFGISAGAMALAGRTSSWAGAFALLAVAFLLAFRWEYVSVYRRAAREARAHRGRPV